jgi:hypothetical protein
MNTSPAKFGIILAQELRKQSEQDGAVTPMDAVVDMALKGQVSDDQRFRLLARLWTLKRLCTTFTVVGPRAST